MGLKHVRRFVDGAITLATAMIIGHALWMLGMARPTPLRNGVIVILLLVCSYWAGTLLET
jgi:hypothetical protein